MAVADTIAGIQAADQEIFSRSPRESKVETDVARKEFA